MHKSQEDTRPPLPGAGHVENYTVPFLVVFAFLVYFTLLAIWAVYGLPSALIAAVVADRFIPRRES